MVSRDEMREEARDLQLREHMRDSKAANDLFPLKDNVKESVQPNQYTYQHMEALEVMKAKLENLRKAEALANWEKGVADGIKLYRQSHIANARLFFINV